MGCTAWTSLDCTVACTVAGILLRGATAIDHPPHSQPAADLGYAAALVTGLTLLAFAIHGYHPYSEDGGLYIAGIKWLLHPELYPASLPFVKAHLRFSLFAPFMAALVHTSRLGLPVVLLAVHLASLWATLFALWLIAERCHARRPARTGAVLLMALWLTMPIAGTSLLLVDPYLTARSLSLPCTLFALAATLACMRPEGRGGRVRAAILGAVSLGVAALMHPLMAGYGLGAVLLLACLLAENGTVRRWGAVSLCATAIVGAGILQMFAHPEPAGYLPIALSRYYWFLARWQWYELLGLVAPLAILSLFALRSRKMEGVPALARMAVLAGITATVIALLFAHEGYKTHLVARLQPLRIFQLVYIVMIVALGGLLGERLLRTSWWRWLALAALFGAIFFGVQRTIYPSSAHIEWPGVPPRNQWEQAFVWIDRHTPVDALFALDAHYISAPGEDAQCFRALAGRSSLPDYSKDGGEASITPSLTPLWTAGQRAQENLSGLTDDERLARLRPLNVTWVVLEREAKTAFDCPFRNPRAQVCRLP